MLDWVVDPGSLLNKLREVCVRVRQLRGDDDGIESLRKMSPAGYRLIATHCQLTLPPCTSTGETVRPGCTVY